MFLVQFRRDLELIPVSFLGPGHSLHPSALVGAVSAVAAVQATNIMMQHI